MADKENNKDLIKDHLNTLKELEEIRRPYEAQIDEIFTYIYHGRRKIKDEPNTSGTSSTYNKGKKTGIQVFDGTALHAVNLLTDGLTGYTISKSFKWFGYTLPQKINFAQTSLLRSAGGGRRLDSFPEVKRWLEDTEEAMNAAFLASNIYDIAPEFVRDAATVGTVTINADEDIAGGRTVFSVPHFRECYCAENYFGMVDTNFRVRELTLKQMVEKFGYDQMVEADPIKFRKDYETNRNAKRKVLHARYPRKDRDPQKLNGGNKPFASLWIMLKPEKLLKESGTDHQNFVTWRWRKNNDEWYGRSPSWDAYVDVMTAQQQGKTNLIAGQKAAEPPMYGPEDLRGMVQRGPNGWTSVQDTNNIPRPLHEGIQLPFSLEMQNITRNMIRDHYSVDFFTQLSQAAMQKVELTATQVIEMGGEKAAVLGPRIGRLETEALNPIHDMMFSIERRAGRIPEPPDILLEFSGGNIEIEYLGPLAQAQKKLFRGQGIRQGLENLAGASELFPQVLDLIEPDEMGRDILRAANFPQKDIRDEDAVKEIRTVRQQQEVQAQQLEESLQIAKAMPAAGKEVSPNSALGAAAGMEGG